MSEGGSIFRVIREGNDAFEGAYPGPKREETFIRFDESANNKVFETANGGMTRKDVQEKNERAVDELFENFEKESKKENISKAFEKEDHELPKIKEEVKGLDLDMIKKMENQLEKEGTKKEKEMSHNEMGMSGPLTKSSMGFL